MMNNKYFLTIPFVTLGLISLPCLADNAQPDKSQSVERIVVTGELMKEPTKTYTDPKKPRLPLPAYDGAGFLKTIPGFSIGRKGGAGGDPSLRGLGGSRLSIVDDGQHVAGTCGGRMDPPTAYIYPEAYDNITVIKGPQTVKYGPVGSAGTVLFEKDRHSFDEPGLDGRASMTAGSFGRTDYLVELKAGDEKHYFDMDVNQSSSDHYKDGDGNKVQSSYDRSNYNFALGWTPTEQTVLELAYGSSSGEAEYADRANKAREISNENYTLLLQHEFESDWLNSIELQAYSNENDHVMDQFDQGVNSGTNVRRATQGGHLWLDLSLASDWTLTLGVDHMDSTHDGRSINPAVDNGLDDLLNKPFKDNMRYQTSGLFIESTYELSRGQLLAGARYDHWKTELMVAQKGERSDDLFSGYGRYELSTGNSQYYAGIGHAQRIPDYWEIMKADVNNPSQKAFDLAPEKTTQLDIGWIYEADIAISTSLFYGEIRDYILIDANTEKTSAYNIDATIYGGEVATTIPLTEHFSTQTSVSYSHGDNDTAGTPLGQIPPLEGRITLDYQYNQWTAGLLWRLVAAQDRVAIGEGNISGQDLAESSGFGTLSFNASWKHNDALLVSFGVENLFDITYAEHISRSGAGNDIPGSEPTFQVNEPGRTAWVKVDYTF